MKLFKITNKILLYLVFITIFFMLVGLTYSYFVADLSGAETNTTITAEAGKMDIVYNGGANITAEGIAPSINPFATKNFTVTGTSTVTNSEMGYKITLIIDENTLTNNAISYTLTSTNTSSNGKVAIPITERQGLGTTNKELGTGKFQGVITNGVHTYELKIYFYETNEDQTVDMNKIFRAHVGIENYNPCASGDCLKDKILAQGGGKAIIEAKGTPDFSKISVSQSTYDLLPETEINPYASKEIAIVDGGLYATEDEYGMSYYYRGERNLLNNNLIFGGFQWKMIRINGDGSVRIIYNGTEAQFTTNGTMNTTGINTQINGTHKWNVTSSNDAKYEGYMYGGDNGVASTQRSGSLSSAATYNETSNNAKIQLETWYQNNIAGKSFENKIVDNIFCNDRQLQSEIGGPVTGLGYGSSQTQYAGGYRLIHKNLPTLRCGLKNDRFSVSDIIMGNGTLTYAVGLMSADEASMGGLIWYTYNSKSYLYTNQPYWLFSPSYFASNARVWFVDYEGDLEEENITYSKGLRPVINLDSDVKVTGTGTINNPYIVIT